MKRWEYKIEHNIDEDRLNDLGHLRWELINIYKIHPENYHIKFVFKREIR